jgi:hypothetical protein
MDYRDDFRGVAREIYWSLPRILAVVLCVVIVAYVIGFFVTGGDLIIYRVFAPRYENAKRNVFEQTQSYVDGKIAYLSTLRLDYESAKAQPGAEIRRESLRRLIVTEAAQVDNAKLPDDLRVFVSDLKAGVQ